MSRVARATCFLLAMTVLGCGGGSSGPARPKLYPASGRVTVGGKPLTGCNVMLSIPGLEGAYVGTLGSNGEFHLQDALTKMNGAPVGKYKVSFQQSLEEAKKAMMSGGGTPGYSASEKFPKEYADPVTSPKEVEIKAETNTLLIEI